MDSHYCNLYLADFGRAGAYVFRAPDNSDAAARVGDVDSVLREYVESVWPHYDFNILSRAAVRKIPAAEADSYAGYRTLDAATLGSLAADVRREAADAAGTRALNSDSPWADAG